MACTHRVSRVRAADREGFLIRSGVHLHGGFNGGETLIVRHNCIEHLDPVFMGDGNVDIDPDFVRPRGADGLIGSAGDDFRLSPGSPVIDTGPGSPPVVDMGAYER